MRFCALQHLTTVPIFHIARAPPLVASPHPIKKNHIPRICISYFTISCIPTQDSTTQSPVATVATGGLILTDLFLYPALVPPTCSRLQAHRVLPTAPTSTPPPATTPQHYCLLHSLHERPRGAAGAIGFVPIPPSIRVRGVRHLGYRTRHNRIRPVSAA